MSELLLNDDYVMLPFGELSRRRDYVFDSIGAAGRVFIRPDSPLKLFTGQVASADSFEADLEFMAFYDFPPSSLVVVSSPKEIESEWRFIVAGGEVITGCLYCKDGEHQPAPGSHQGAYDLAAVAASSSWQPDPVWVVDVCRTSAGEYRLLEVGGFSYSDLYATDKTAIAEAVSAAAIQVWVQHEAG